MIILSSQACGSKWVRFCNFAAAWRLQASNSLRVRAALAVMTLAIFGLKVLRAQQAGPAPVTVQPGAPGQSSKAIPPTGATLPPPTQADAAFMQGMIMHHSQAVEMTALIQSRTQNKDVRSIGSRISISQTDEMLFMKHWLAVQGRTVPALAADHSMAGMDMGSMHGTPNAPMLMPGMLTPAQMAALRKASGAQFDHLFLTGMIQHHTGALVMVKDLFETPGAGQDADLFNFATDVDNTQRAEIRIMQGMLSKETQEKP